MDARGVLRTVLPPDTVTELRESVLRVVKEDTNNPDANGVCHTANYIKILYTSISRKRQLINFQVNKQKKTRKKFIFVKIYLVLV